MSVNEPLLDIRTGTQSISKPLSHERFTGSSERTDQQWNRLLTIITGLQNGSLRPSDLSLGIDSKRGIGPISDTASGQFNAQCVANAEAAIRRTDTLSKYPDDSSKRQWITASKNQQYFWNRTKGPKGEASWYQWRVFLHHNELKDGDRVVNDNLARQLSKVLAAMRLTGVPIKFKDGSSNFQVVYGRDQADAIYQVLGVFNEFSAWDLANRLESLSLPSLSYKNPSEFDREIVQRALFIAPFPGDPYFEVNSWPVDPSISFRDRVSADPVDPNILFHNLRTMGTALQLGRMGATARAIFSPHDHGSLDSFGLTSEEGISNFVTQYLLNGATTLPHEHVELQSENSLPGEVNVSTDIKKQRPKANALLFKSADSANIHALVDWRQQTPEIRFLFVFKISQDDPVIYQAATRLLRK